MFVPQSYGATFEEATYTVINTVKQGDSHCEMTVTFWYGEDG